MFYISALALYSILIFLNIAEVKKITHATKISLDAFLMIIVMIPLMPFILLLLAVFAVYRLIISMVLRIIHGKDFYGLLSGSDAFHLVGDASKFITISCFIYRAKDCTFERFHENAKTAVSKTFRLKKFNTFFCKAFGYPYIVKQELDIMNHCLGVMKTVETDKKKLDKDEFFELLNYHYNEPMPNGGRSPCLALIGSQPIKWRDDDYDYYPIMFKIHHAVGDGIALIKALVGSLKDDLILQSEEIQPAVSKKKNKQAKMLKYIFEILKTIFYIVILYPSTAVAFLTYKAKDVNALRNTSLTHENVLGIGLEEKEEYIEKIKKIKRKFPGTAFSTILIAAYSASLNEYFKKNCSNHPQYITASIPILEGAENLRYLKLEKINVEKLKIENTYSLIMLKLPIAIKNDNKIPINKQLMYRLKFINKEVDIIKNSLEYRMNSFFMQVACAVLPEPLIKLFLESMRSTTIISILVGQPKMIYKDGPFECTSCIGWVPHLHNIGTSICTMTYDGRIYIGLSVDKVLIPNRCDVQAITDNVYKYLDILYEEAEEYRD